VFCCVHAGGCKEYPGLGRGNFNAIVDAQDSFQTYLPMFESAVAPVGKPDPFLRRHFRVQTECLWYLPRQARDKHRQTLTKKAVDFPQVAEGGGGSAAIMSSFSHVNGVTMVDNSYLQQTGEARNACLEPFCIQYDHFTKTGSFHQDR
jgi:hypothetical protein